MRTLPEQVDYVIKSNALFPDNCSILVAVSGGLDSMTLLWILQYLAPRHHWRIHAAHFNHQLRGPQSDADAHLVQTAARQLGCHCFTGQNDVRRHAKSTKTSIEMAARTLRHQFLAQAADRARSRHIALAHHADDQIELFFLRLLRGSGAEGLGGMKSSNPSPANPHIQLVRPLLTFQKQDLLNFARAKQIPFNEDATNAQTEFLRNRIRHELLPLLKSHYQHGLPSAVLRTIQILSTQSDFIRQFLLEQQLHGTFSFNHAHPALQREALLLQLQKLNLPPDFDLIEHLRLKPESKTMVQPELTLSRQSDGTIATQSLTPIQFQPAQLHVRLSTPRGAFHFANLSFKWQIIKSKIDPRKLPTTPSDKKIECFDANRVGSQIHVRHWQPGDRFQPIGATKPIKLQDLFTNTKIPRHQRHQLALATTQYGEIFWVQYLRIGEHFKLDKQTVSSLKWEWQPVAERYRRC